MLLLVINTKRNLFAHSLFLLALIATLIPSLANSISLPGQTVTYADFNYIRHLSASQQHVYFATTEGIIVYDKLEENWIEPLTGAQGIDQRSIRKIWADRFDEHIYVETDLSLYEYDRFFEKWYSVTNLSELQTDQKHVNIPGHAFMDAGYIYTPDGRIYDQYSRDFSITDIVADNAGDLWFGTWGNGAAKMRPATDRLELIPYGLIQNSVSAIYNDSGFLWLAGPIGFSRRTGVTVFDPNENRFDYYESGVESFFPAMDINCLERLDDFLIIGSDLGLFFLNIETGQVEKQLTTREKLADDLIYSLVVQGDSIYVGTAGGLNLVLLPEFDVLQVWPDQFHNVDIYDLQVVDSTIWIASSAGAFQLTTNRGRLRQFQDIKMELFGAVFDIEYFAPNLWLATNDIVLQLNIETAVTVSHTIQSRNFRSRPMSANSEIVAVAADQGVAVIFHKADPPFSRTFTIDDGLPSDLVLEVELDGDFLWIGSDKGLTRFWWNNPDRID